LKAALTQADTDLITKTVERAAYSESLTEFCSARQPASQAANNQALDHWKARNQWNVFQRSLAAQAQFSPAFSEKTKYIQI